MKMPPPGRWFTPGEGLGFLSGKPQNPLFQAQSIYTHKLAE